jgi:hypothetical protein
VDVRTLRNLFRHLQLWRSQWEAREVGESLPGADGREYNLHDIEYLYECRNFKRADKDGNSVYVLSARQRQAIELFLYHNLSERDTSLIMGIAETNPIGMYAKDGLEKLVGGQERAAGAR